MSQNELVPPGLPLVSDATLIRTAVEFEHVCELLQRTSTSGTQMLLANVVDALHVVEDELRARGLEAWCSHAPVSAVCAQ